MISSDDAFLATPSVSYREPPPSSPAMDHRSDSGMPPSGHVAGARGHWPVCLSPRGSSQTSALLEMAEDGRVPIPNGHIWGALRLVTNISLLSKGPPVCAVRLYARPTHNSSAPHARHSSIPPGATCLHQLSHKEYLRGAEQHRRGARVSSVCVVVCAHTLTRSPRSSGARRR